jgi:hypothetical protein
MEVCIVLERYKDYCNVLKGKQIMEQYVNAFEIKNEKFINNKNEKGNFLIYNTTRIMMDKDRYRTHMYNTEEYIKGSYSYSLYLHKIKDMVILVAPVINTLYNSNYDNNMMRYFKYKFRQLGFNCVEYDNRKVPFGPSGPYGIIRTKILIDIDKTQDDLQQLILFIEKLNNFIMNSQLTVWDNNKTIFKEVDILFTEYVKKPVDCT